MAINKGIAPKPFLKWAGGKSQILDKIRGKYPAEIGKSITKYAEPFVGGGAVLFDVLNSYHFEKVYISDVNQELIFTYLAIRDRVSEFIVVLKDFEANYLSAGDEARKKIYYANRERFNILKKGSGNDLELAALFLFLNKTCFNGLYRVNSLGEFNVPQGNYKNPKICDEINLRNVSEILQRVDIVCADYKQSRCFIDGNTFAYFDPPYRPLSITASFNSYSNDGFDDAKQAELACFIDEITAQGAYIVASNSDPKNTNKNDDFFDRMYAKYLVTRISAHRMINSVAAKRGSVNELLITKAKMGAINA